MLIFGRITKLSERITKLGKSISNNPNNPKLFNKAINALKQGKNKTANDLFAQIAKNNVNTIKIVAEVAFQRVQIAKDDICYTDALKHYQTAHYLAPENTPYLNELGRLFITHWASIKKPLNIMN